MKHFIAALVAVALAVVTVPALAQGLGEIDPSDTGFGGRPPFRPMPTSAPPPVATPAAVTSTSTPPLNVQLTAVAMTKKLPISTDQVKGWLLTSCITALASRGDGECTLNSKTDDNMPTDFIVTATLAPSGKGGLTVNLEWAERGKKSMTSASKTFAKPTPKDVKAFVSATLSVIMAGIVSALEVRMKQAEPEEDPGDFTTGLVAPTPATATQAPAPVDSGSRPGMTGNDVDARLRGNDKVRVRPNWPWYVAGTSGVLGIGLGWVANSERGKIATAQNDFDHASSQAVAETARTRGDDAKSRATIFGASAIGVATVGVVVSGLQLGGVFDREVTVTPTPSGAAVSGKF